MKSDSPRWQSFGASPFPWEADALTHLRETLPDVDPIRVWSLFEFISNDGNINEVDALVLTAKGLFLVEIKSQPWVLTGDASTWTWKLPDGKRQSRENPLLGANRKAKRLRSLLERQKALQTHRLLLAGRPSARHRAGPDPGRDPGLEAGRRQGCLRP